MDPRFAQSSGLLRRGYYPSPLKNLILFFSKDKNQIEKFPLSDFFPRLQSTLGISAFIFSYFRRNCQLLWIEV